MSAGGPPAPGGAPPLGGAARPEPAGAARPEPGPSAAALAAELGDRLPPADSVPAEALALTARVRELVEAAVLTDVPPADLALAAERVAAVTELLRGRQRDHLHLVRHPDGRVESLRQAGSGRLNPQAPPIEWLDRPTEPPPGSPPRPVEVRARCTFGAAHGGSPGRVYGGVVAVVLDEVTGVALRAAGATGLTVALNVALRAAVPLGVTVEVAARYTGGEGRKSFATGELTVGGAVAARAETVWVAPRS
ncbi:MAG TPA: PaaI family thioesterase [Acidimicrobiales bacterium]